MIHPEQVRCILPVGITDIAEPYLITGFGDIIRVYDLSTFDAPELIREMDAHWHDILVLRLWYRKSVGEDGLTRVEPWVISTSLDGTIRKWRLTGTHNFTFYEPPPPLLSQLLSVCVQNL